MGKQRIIAETGAGQHGVATATVARASAWSARSSWARKTCERQSLNVFRMKLLGAEGPRRSSPAVATLKDAMNEALRDWVTNVRRHVLHHRLGRGTASVSDDGARLSVGHRPRSAPADPAERGTPAGLRWSPASAAAATRWGCSIRSSRDRQVKMIGVEAAGHGARTGKHAASIQGGHGGRPARQQELRACRMNEARSPRRIRSRPGSTIPASARN